MDKIIGPACPACGCEDSDIVKSVVRWGEATVRRRCNHCGVIWTAPPEEPEPVAAGGDAKARRKKWEAWKSRSR